VTGLPELRRQTLEIGGFRLRPLEAGDAAELLSLFADPEVAEFMDIAPLTGIAEAQEIIAWAMELAKRNQGVRWAIRRDAQLIGTVGFNSLELERGRRGEVAYDLARAEWGHGVMSAILPHVMAFGYERLGLRRLEAMVTAGNHRSCALLERHGFVREGLLRDHGYWTGRFWDQIVYGRLSD